MYTHEFQKRVRYGETDKMGYLYYGNYAQYYEIGRVEMLRSVGLTYRDMEDEHAVLMPVVEMKVKYFWPAYYDDLITIRTKLLEMPDRFITFHVDLINETGKIINRGIVKLCFVDSKTGKTVRTPDYLLEKFRPFIEES